MFTAFWDFSLLDPYASGCIILIPEDRMSKSLDLLQTYPLYLFRCIPVKVHLALLYHNVLSINPSVLVFWNTCMFFHSLGVRIGKRCALEYIPKPQALRFGYRITFLKTTVISFIS